MGVDIETYRGRIGTFKFALGTDVVMLACFINFSYGLKSVCAVVFIGMLLLMAGIEPNPGPITTGGSPELDNCTTIRVTGIPSDVDEAYLKLVFKNTKRQRGGKVKSVQLNKMDRTALVEFEDPKAVKMVLMKIPIKIADYEVGVEAVVRSQCTVEVQGFPMIDSIQELLELYFEDEESSGGDTIVEIKLIADGKALVTYETEEVARRVAAKTNHIVKRPLTVILYNGTDPGVDHSVQDQSVKELEENTENLSNDTDIVHKEPSPSTPTCTEPESQKLSEPLRAESGIIETVSKYQEPMSTTYEISEPLPDKETVKEQFVMNNPVHEDLIRTEHLPNESDLCESVPKHEMNTEQVRIEAEPNKPLPEDQTMTEPVLSEIELSEPVPEAQPVLEQAQRESDMESPVSDGQTEVQSASKESELASSGKQNQAEPISEESESEHLSNDTDIVHKEPSPSTPTCTEPESQKLSEPLRAESGIIETVSKYQEPMSTTYEISEPLPDKETVQEQFVMNNPVHEDLIRTEHLPTEPDLCESVPKHEMNTEQVRIEAESNKPLPEDRTMTIPVLSEIELSEPVAEAQPVLEQAQTESDMESPVSDGQTEVQSASKESELASPGKQNQEEPISEESESEKQSKSDMEQRREEGDIEAKCEEGNAEHQTLHSDTELNKESVAFGEILRKLELVDKYPGIISMTDVIAIDPDDATEYDKQAIPLREVPWVMLKRLMCAHSESRDITTNSGTTEEKQTEFDLSVSYIVDEEDEPETLSPLDIFAVVVQCCDPFLKQVLFQKMYLCKLAVPFLYKAWNETYFRPVLSVWPLRSLTIENKHKSTGGSVKTDDVLHFPSKVLVFSRFGRPRYSKSRLLNCLLTSQGCNTFFNIDCPSGTTPRLISHGQVEMFWLPLVGGKRDKFKDAMTFMNMRGDIVQHFPSKTYKFVANIADAVTIVADMDSIHVSFSELKRVILAFPSVILIIANPLTNQDKVRIRQLQTDVTKSGKVNNFRILSTHKGTVEQNVFDMVNLLSNHIESHLKLNKVRSIDERLTDLTSSDVFSDENDNDCLHGKCNAERLLKTMKNAGTPKKWKQMLTPVHSKYSRDLGALKKKREREKGLTEGEHIDQKMREIRIKQTQAITATVKDFIQMFIENLRSGSRLHFFLKWLHYFIEREKREILPKLMQENNEAWEKLKTLKSKTETNATEIEKQESEITRLEYEIDDASFSVEHFFREIGHIYEAILELNHNPSDFELPTLSITAESVAQIVAKGHQLEFIDGESFYMPFQWIQEVMKHTEKIIRPCKVMVLSVLGLQCSGKSTLLNTMFGSQFSTRTGRCTRGIHIQLVPTRVVDIKRRMSPFEYVLVVDTEGLRSPELSHVQHEHDNELATVITGLGDMTILNIMGENTSEIRDILQVIVHAFLRLKMANRNLDLRKCCAFIHQNVTDTSASENMISGLSKLMQTLDAMTNESARSEGILDITTFNQVIEFDIKYHVWYLKNLRQGNPPMARVNTEYSESVVGIKRNILKRALNMVDKSYKSLGDITEQAYSLWKGVLNEDFVFSFRNCLEIRAYMDMEAIIQGQLWQLESRTRDRLVNESQRRFGSCTLKEDLRSVADSLTQEVKDFLSEERLGTERFIATYFEKNKYKDIIIQWKSNQQNRIENVCHMLERTITEHVEKNYAKRSVEIVTVSSQRKHEEELRVKSMEVVDKFKGKKLSQSEIDGLFAEIWKGFIAKVHSGSYSSDVRKDIRKVFVTFLKNIFKKDAAILKECLLKSCDLTPLPDLKKLPGSYLEIGIDENEDISMSKVQKGLEFFRFSDVMKKIKSQVEDILKTVDDKIDSFCHADDEITEMQVRTLLHDLESSIRDIPTEKGRYGFKPAFRVKIFVHVSRYAIAVFEKHNENYFKTKGIAVLLEQYRQQQKISFEAHLRDRASEDIIAQLFCNVVEGFAKEYTSTNISNKIMDELHAYLPPVKNRVIIDICKSLAVQNKFKDFVRYLNDPRNYAYRWIRTEATKHIFCKQSGIYYKTTKSLVYDVFNKAERCLEKLKYKLKESPASSVDTLVDVYCLISKEEELSIPPESYRNVRKENVVVKNVEYLTDMIIAYMLQSKESVVNEFRSVTENNVTWKNYDPIENLFKKTWGCPEKCPFCGEPCAKNDDHKGDVHFCLLHKPSSCIGVRELETGNASLTACNFDVNSEFTHTCGVFNFACKKGSNDACDEPCTVPHRYRDYKKFYSDWDIPPSSAMHEHSKFWMWFMATYKSELCQCNGYKLDHMPPSWSEIKQQEAIDSLEKTYSVSKH